MFKFIGKALAGLVLTKDAQDAVGRHGAGSPAAKGKGKARPAGKAVASKAKGGKAAPARNAAIAQVQDQVKDLITPDRAELIRQAMKVRAAKQTILADLGDEDRARLVALAMKALLNEDRNKE
jgi:hypothetical protein